MAVPWHPHRLGVRRAGHRAQQGRPPGGVRAGDRRHHVAPLAAVPGWLVPVGVAGGPAQRVVLRAGRRGSRRRAVGRVRGRRSGQRQLPGSAESAGRADRPVGARAGRGRRLVPLWLRLPGRVDLYRLKQNEPNGSEWTQEAFLLDPPPLPRPPTYRPRPAGSREVQRN